MFTHTFNIGESTSVTPQTLFAIVIIDTEYAYAVWNTHYLLLRHTLRLAAAAGYYQPPLSHIAYYTPHAGYRHRLAYAFAAA